MNTLNSKYYVLKELVNLNNVKSNTLFYEDIKTEDNVASIRKNKLTFISKLLPEAIISYGDYFETESNCLYINIQSNGIFIGFIKKEGLERFLVDSKNHYTYHKIEIYSEIKNQRIFIKEYFNPIRTKKLKPRNKDNNEHKQNSCSNTRESNFTIIDDPTQR